MKIVAGLVFGIVCGLVLYLNPVKYSVSGTFFVQRQAEQNGDFFKYEGYYAQQTAQNFTNNVVALFESADLTYDVLVKANIEPTDRNLKKFSKRIATKKVGPQVVVLSVKSQTPQEAETLWKALKSSFDSRSIELKKADPYLEVNLLGSIPKALPEDRNLIVYLTLGGLAGILMSVTLLVLVNAKKELNLQ